MTRDHLEEARKKARAERDAINQKIAEGIAGLRFLFDRRKEEDERLKEPNHEEKNRAVIREYEERKAKGEKVELWTTHSSTGTEAKAIGSNPESTSLTYFIREPKEPTLEERNAAVRVKWESMVATEDKTIRVKGGKRFQVQYWSKIKDEWRPVEPWWSPVDEYRIVELPAPKFGPFTRENCPVGKVIRWKSSGLRELVTGASETGATIAGTSWIYAMLLQHATMDDGSPAGSEVRE